MRWWPTRSVCITIQQHLVMSPMMVVSNISPVRMLSCVLVVAATETFTTRTPFLPLSPKLKHRIKCKRWGPRGKRGLPSRQSIRTSWLGLLRVWGGNLERKRRTKSKASALRWESPVGCSLYGSATTVTGQSIMLRSCSFRRHGWISLGTWH